MMLTLTMIVNELIIVSYSGVITWAIRYPPMKTRLTADYDGKRIRHPIPPLLI